MALCLSLEQGERLLIGDCITIELIRIDNGCMARLAITAPREIAVDRECVRAKKLAQKLRESNTDAKAG